MRAILKLILVAGVATLFGFADSIELYAAGGAALLLLPFAIWRIDRRAKPIQAKPVEPFADKAAVTMNVMPLPRPLPVDDDIEGKTVRAPTAHEQAYEMHARYATAFDQQAAIGRYEARRGEPGEHAVPEQDPPSFDQRRYADALQYAEAFEAQLSKQRRTAAYQVAQPRRVARGSYTPQQYRNADARSDQQAPSREDWDDPKTLIGVKPAK
jgi:hypothetical protein